MRSGRGRLGADTTVLLRKQEPRATNVVAGNPGLLLSQDQGWGRAAASPPPKPRAFPSAPPRSPAHPTAYVTASGNTIFSTLAVTAPYSAPSAALSLPDI